MGVIKKHILEKENPNDEFAIVTKKLFTDNEHVKDSDLVLEFETSKANFEVYADAEGYIKYFFNVDDNSFIELLFPVPMLYISNFFRLSMMVLIAFTTSEM